MRPRRALLYVPGDQERKIVKASGLAVDSVCLDLEDGVAWPNKAAARALSARLLRSLAFKAGERLVRIHSPEGPQGGMAAEDLAVVLEARPDGIVLPKVEAAWQVQWVAYRLQRAEEAHGWPPGGIRLLAILETARGLVQREAIARATPRLDALLFGAEDYTADVGARRTPDNREVLFARQAVVAAAKAYDLQALDIVYVRYKDLDGLAREAREAADWGFDGKQVIHPAQVPVVQHAFTPDEEAVDHARRVLATYRRARAQGVGVVGLDGKMVDMPMVKAARRVLARAGLTEPRDGSPGSWR